jgi:hypothetical protein
MNNDKQPRYTAEDYFDYLLGEMPEAARSSFEAALHTDPQLQASLAAFRQELQTNLAAGAIRADIQAAVQQRHNWWHRLSYWLQGHTLLVSGGAAAVIGIIIWACLPAPRLTFAQQLSAAAIDSIAAPEYSTVVGDNGQLYLAKNYAAYFAATAHAPDTLLLFYNAIAEVRAPEFATNARHQTHALRTLSMINQSSYAAQKRHHLLFYATIAALRLHDTAEATHYKNDFAAFCSTPTPAADSATVQSYKRYFEQL